MLPGSQGGSWCLFAGPSAAAARLTPAPGALLPESTCRGRCSSGGPPLSSPAPSSGALPLWGPRPPPCSPDCGSPHPANPSPPQACPLTPGPKHPPLPPQRVRARAGGSQEALAFSALASASRLLPSPQGTPSVPTGLPAGRRLPGVWKPFLFLRSLPGAQVLPRSLCPRLSLVCVCAIELCGDFLAFWKSEVFCQYSVDVL